MRSRVAGGHGSRRAVTLCTLAVLLCGGRCMAATSDVPPPKLSAVGENALKALDKRRVKICPASKAPAQCVNLNGSLLKLTGSFAPGAKPEDLAISSALNTAGSALNELLRSSPVEKKKLYSETIEQLGVLEKDVFSSDAAAALSLVQTAQSNWPGGTQPSDLEQLVGILDPLRGASALPSVGNPDAASALKWAFKKLEASEDVLRSPPATTQLKTDAVAVTSAKKTISRLQASLPSSPNASQNRGNDAGAAHGPVPPVDAVDTVTAILNGLISSNDSLSRYSADHPSTDKLSTDLEDAVAYLAQMPPGSKIQVAPDARLDADCPAKTADVGECLGRANIILESALSSLPADDKGEAGKKWLLRTQRAIARHLSGKAAASGASSWPALASTAFSLIALVLMAITWRKATASARAPAKQTLEISPAGETELQLLEVEMGTQARAFEALSEQNLALQQKSDADARALVTLKRQMQKLQDTAAPPEDDARPMRGASRQDAEAGLKAPASARASMSKSAPQSAEAERIPQRSKEPEEFSGDVRDDYNLARQKGDEAQERFARYYGRPFSVSCSNLADRTVEDGKLMFKRAERTVFMAVQDKMGRMWLFPQFNVDYRPSFSMMDGIFSYPGGTSENLKLELPGYLVPSGDKWELDFPGEFVNA